jgi:hypothetical protein
MLIFVAGFVVHEFRQSAKAEKKAAAALQVVADRGSPTMDNSSSGAGVYSNTEMDSSHSPGKDTVPLMQRMGDPTGLSDPFPASYFPGNKKDAIKPLAQSVSGGALYEDEGSSLHAQNAAMLHQQQQLLKKMDMLVSLMQRDLLTRGIVA